MIYILQLFELNYKYTERPKLVIFIHLKSSTYDQAKLSQIQKKLIIKFTFNFSWMDKPYLDLQQNPKGAYLDRK